MRNLFTLRGTLRPAAYFAWGTGLLLLKLALDAALVHLLFAGASWSPLLYLQPLHWSQVYPATTPWQCLLFGAAALPFLWMGVSLTLRRLRDAGMPTWLIALFVVPALNVLFYLLLALVWPSKTSPPVANEPDVAAVPESLRPLDKFVANLLGLAVLGGTFAVSVGLLQSYGAGLFLCAPFLHGFVVALWLVPRGFTTRGAIGAALAGLLLPMLLLLLAGIEGLGCLAMSLPLIVPAAAIGAAMGASAVEPWSPRYTRPSASRGALLLLLGPCVAAAEHALAPAAEVHEVTSSIEIAAAPAQIWPLVVAFPALPEPDEFLFRAGIAYPTSARIDGEGEGAVRHCTFNTGSFKEPITAWQPPHRLAFDVVDSPQPMIEWNPLFAHVDAPHLHGFFRAQRGEFRLEELPGGHTRLCGTTWYAHGLRPEWYWRLWSDLMVHRIHARVLDHIAALAEGRR